MLKTKLSVVFVLGFFAISSIAATPPICNTPKEKWMKEPDLRRALRRQGYLVGTIRIDRECYELYGLDPRGRRIQILIDPETAKPVVVQ